MDVTPNYYLPYVEPDDYIRQFPNSVSKLLADRVDAAIKDAKWFRGRLLSGTLNDYFDLADAGIYEVMSAVEDKPAPYGSLEVIPQANSVTQRFTSWLVSSQIQTWVRTIQSGTPTPWQEVGGAGVATRAISSGSITDYRTPDKAGFYRVTNAYGVSGLPVQALGILAALPMSNSNILYYTAWYNNGTPRVFVLTFSGTTTSEWVELTGGSSNVTIEQGLRTSRGVITADQALATFNARLMDHTTQPVPLVFAGSSTTAGNGATSPANRWVDQLTTFLQAKYPNGATESTVQASGTGDFIPETGPGIHGYNIGRGGTQADDYLTDADTATIAALDPALIVHMVGSNDYARRRPITTYQADLEHRIDHLSAAITVPHTHVLVQQFQRQDRTDPNPVWTAYAQALQEIAEDRPDQVAYINISEAFNTTGLDQDDPFGFFGPDDVHTNDAGHTFLAHLMAIGLGEK